jgi:hypothetical protein
MVQIAILWIAKYFPAASLSQSQRLDGKDPGCNQHRKVRRLNRALP